MIHRIMLAAALLAAPAIVVAEQPALATAHGQQADSSKTKSKAKVAHKGMHKKGGKSAAPKTAPKDSGSAK
jgi:hypothetical protein